MHSISIGTDLVMIDQYVISLPIAIDELKTIVGGEPVENKTKANTIFAWDDVGIYAYSAKGKVAEAIGIQMRMGEYKFRPKNVFQGKITVNGVSLSDWPVKKKEADDTYSTWIAGDTTVYLDLNDAGDIMVLEFSAYTPEVIPEPDRYAFKPIAGKPMQFVDLSFKLSVIQVLMYEKELIKPAFDIFEFARRHTTRAIDVDAEGYDIIPEALEYFKRLEVDEALAPEVDEITQDGGNDIYMNIIPFWSGTTDDFNIRSFEDVDQFPNLRYMTLFYDDEFEAIQQRLAGKGIRVEPL